VGIEIVNGGCLCCYVHRFNAPMGLLIVIISYSLCSWLKGGTTLLSSHRYYNWDGKSAVPPTSVLLADRRGDALIALHCYYRDDRRVSSLFLYVLLGRQECRPSYGFVIVFCECSYRFCAVQVLYNNNAGLLHQ